VLSLWRNTFGAKEWLKGWSIFIITFPFYFFSAGQPQLSDMFSSLVMFGYLLSGNFRVPKDFGNVVARFRSFIIYICIVNFILFLVRIGFKDKGLPWFVVDSFYLYNFMVFCFSISLYRKYGTAFLYTTLYSVLFSAIIQVVLSPWGHIDEGRSTLFFTNPNQLGYYSVCALCIVLTMEKLIKVKRSVVLASFAFFIYFAMLSVSKAAIGSIVILFGVYLLSNKLLQWRTILIIFVVGIGLYVTLIYTEPGQNFILAMTGRIENSVKPEDVSEWEYRGYDRIANHPGYLILGAGEGAYNRFNTYINNHEIHSSIGTIVFCYGIPGTVLFTLLIISLIKGLPRDYIIYMLPIISYGIAHMGLRFTIFWITLAMFPIARHSFKWRARQAKAAIPPTPDELPQVA
jgi:hypothetical protein